MPAPRLELSDIRKAYGPQLILDGLALQLEGGEVVAIRGASGTGKSTLLHILGLLDQADSGSYRFGEQELVDLPRRERDRLRGRSIGFIFQGCHLLPEFSLLENLLLPARCAGLPLDPCRERAEHLLSRVGLPATREDVRTLSGGEAQRAAICRALVAQPELILADEPTGSLDPATATVVLQLLLELAQDIGASVIMVTHDPGVAARAGRQLELREGNLHRVAG